MAAPTRNAADWMIDRLWRGILWLAMRLPWNARVRITGWLFRTLIGPITGRTAIAIKNLEMVFPDWTKEQRRAVAKAVTDNIGRTIIESYTPDIILERAKDWVPSGPGWPELIEARDAGRPIVFVTGHFGNYHAARASLNGRGFEIGGLFRPLNNDYLNDHYVETIAGLGGGAFPRDRRGLAGFVKHLRSGAQGALLIDQYVYDGEILDFMGHPAPTSPAAAELALKYNALLVPVYSIRQDNGFDFDVVFEAPIPHSDALTMTQAFNDSLAARIRETPEQWFWVHDRWKLEKTAKRQARQSSRTAP